MNQRPCTSAFTPRVEASLDQTLAIISSYNVDKALELVNRIEALVPPFALLYEFEESKRHVIFHLVAPGEWNFPRLSAA